MKHLYTHEPIKSKWTFLFQWKKLFMEFLDLSDSNIEWWILLYEPRLLYIYSYVAVYLRVHCIKFYMPFLIFLYDWKAGFILLWILHKKQEYFIWFNILDQVCIFYFNFPSNHIPSVRGAFHLTGSRLFLMSITITGTRVLLFYIPTKLW